MVQESPSLVAQELLSPSSLRVNQDDITPIGVFGSVLSLQWHCKLRLDWLKVVCGVFV